MVSDVYCTVVVSDFDFRLWDQSNCLIFVFLYSTQYLIFLMFSIVVIDVTVILSKYIDGQ